jgi:hypothetical protein
MIKMGMFDTINCKYPLPDLPAGVKTDNCQTKAFGDGFVGGFMDDYTITVAGRLIYHKATYEMVPEEERTYYGTPEWDKNPLLQICGSMKSIPLGDEEMDYTGVVNIIVGVDPVWIEYDIEFVGGSVISVEKLYREFG